MRVTSNGKIHREENEWEEIFERLEGSGLSQKEFCEREKIAPGSLQKWQRKFAEREKKPSFVELRAEAPEGKNEVELRFPSGLVLLIGG